MKIVFIKPNMISGTPCDSIEPLAFAILSALTPERIDRCFYDERLESIPFDAPADLVAISTDVFSAKRAYQIAGIYREKGIPVVIGGYHPSLCPEEASQYVDSVVIGDAEDTWPQVIADADKKALKPSYVSSYPSFGELEPDRSIFAGKSYASISLVEFNRGCRFSCDFCSIRAMYNGKIRHQSLANVLRDIDHNSSKHIFFTDDNFHADIASLKELLNELAKRKVKWSCQISSDIVKHPEIVALMANAGCSTVTVGFESLDRKNLEQMRKSWMQDDCKKVIDIFHDNGIMMYGTFIIGYDHDTPEVFQRTLDFASKNRLFLANFNPLIPTPGTQLYLRMQSEKRLLFDCWWLSKDYHWGDCVFQPKQMTTDELTSGCLQMRDSFFSLRSIMARFPGLKLRKTSFYKTGLFFMANWISRRELNRKYGKPLGDASL